MSVFGAYSRYYDLLYAQKAYAAETAYVERLVGEVTPAATRILDLGCGTALHASHLAGSGYVVVGVDLSETMLASGMRHIEALPQEARTRVRLEQGNICTFRTDETFDAVVSLFHVISYQTGNDDLQSAVGTARAHLEPGGVFLFDCWYGPAVLTDRPERRTRTLENDEISVTRFADPVMQPNENVVEVNYRIVVSEKATGQEEELRETHRMRYLFLPEVERLLDSGGFDLVRAEEWMTGRPPGFDTWSVCFVARARAS